MVTFGELRRIVSQMPSGCRVVEQIVALSDEQRAALKPIIEYVAYVKGKRPEEVTKEEVIEYLSDCRPDLEVVVVGKVSYGSVMGFLPRFDLATVYGHAFLKYLSVDYAKKCGLSIDLLEGDECTRQNFLQHAKASIYWVNLGHGNETTFTGQYKQPIIWVSDNEGVKAIGKGPRCASWLSCLVGRQLVRWLVEDRKVLEASLAYDAEYVFVLDPRNIHNPLKDPYAGWFFWSHCLFDEILFAREGTSGKAYDETVKRYKYCLEKCPFNEVKPYLLHDMEHCVLIGSRDWNMFPPMPPGWTPPEKPIPPGIEPYIRPAKPCAELKVVLIDAKEQRWKLYHDTVPLDEEVTVEVSVPTDVAKGPCELRVWARAPDAEPTEKVVKGTIKELIRKTVLEVLEPKDGFEWYKGQRTVVKVKVSVKEESE